MRHPTAATKYAKCKNLEHEKSGSLFKAPLKCRFRIIIQELEVSWSSGM